MILQKLASAIRRQDWFQVIIEVMIVIVGIFLGLQVQEAYEDRQEREREFFYLNRLHNDVVSNTEFSAEKKVTQEEFLSESIQFGSEVLDVFEELDKETVLGPRHCMALMTSHIYNDQSSFPPTLNELISSGQLSIIQSDELKIAISNYTLAYEEVQNLASGLIVGSVVLARKYPEFITLDRKMRNIEEHTQFTHQCDFGALKENKAFNNDLIDNLARQNAFVETLSIVNNSLTDLHGTLDDVLSIIHGEGGS